MKKSIGIILLVFIGITGIFAQQDDSKVESVKREFIIKELDLTPQEADGFFPIYNEYIQKKREARRTLKKDMNGSNDMNLDKIIGAEQDILNLQKEYTEKFRRVISDKKIVHLFEVEKEFKKMLLRRLKD